MSKIIENIQPIVKFTYNTRNSPNQKMSFTRQQMMDLFDCFNVIIQQVSECKCSKERKAVYSYFKELGCVKKQQPTVRRQAMWRIWNTKLYVTTKLDLKNRI